MGRCRAFGVVAVGAAMLSAGCGGSAGTTASKTSAATAPREPVSSNAYLRELDESCVRAMPAVRLAVVQAEEVERGALSAAVGRTAGPESSALAALRELNRARAVLENRYVIQAEVRGESQVTHPVMKWGLKLQYMTPAIGYFVDPETGPTTAARAAPRLVSAARELSEWAVRAELPDCATPQRTQTSSQPSKAIPSPDASTEPNTTPTTTESSALAGRTRCGTITGGRDDYQGQVLTVYAAPGVSCTTATQVMGDLSVGKAQTHEGPNQASSYFVVDGWTCPYGSMGIQQCSQGGLSILGVTSSAKP